MRHATDGFTDFNAILSDLLRQRQGEAAIEFLVHHPDGDFARTFNALAGGVDGDGIGRVYANTKRTLARLVDLGDIRDLEHLRKAATSVLGMNAFHHGYLSANRANPVVPSARSEETTDAPARLFTDAVDAAAVAADTRAPSDRAEWSEAFAAVLREARRFGPLYVRALHLHKRYEDARDRKTRGAVHYVARRALLDDAGRVIGFQPRRIPVDESVRPAERVVKQVREILAVAFDRLRIVAVRFGYSTD